MLRPLVDGLTTALEAHVTALEECSRDPEQVHRCRRIAAEIELLRDKIRWLQTELSKLDRAEALSKRGVPASQGAGAPRAGRVSGNRVAVALTGKAQRQAGRLYGEVLAFLAELPHSEAEREAFTRLDALDRRRAAV